MHKFAASSRLDSHLLAGFFAFLALMLAVHGCARKQPPVVPKAVADLSYVNGSRDPFQTLDLYLPSSSKTERFPVIVWIHGGAWMGGDKRQVPLFEFLKRGYAVASINYRLASEARFPAQIHDCKAAVRWLRANADKFGLDASRVGVFGHSAGGHLASLMGTTNGEKSVEGRIGVVDHPSDVQAVCDWCGITDFFQIREKAYEAPDSAFRRLLGGDLKTKKEEARLASPVTFVSKDDPPFLIMHGDCDRTVPLAQSRRLAEVLKKNGVPTTFKVLAGANHVFTSDQTIKTVADFFDQNLRSKAVN